MKKRPVLWIICLLVAGVAVALAVPRSRYQLLAMLGNERLVNGRPISYWLAALKDDDPAARRQAALSLGDDAISKDRPKNGPYTSEVVVALADTLGDPDGLVRKCAATSFLLYSRETPLPDEPRLAARLTGALADPEVAVRKAAVRAFWQVNPAPKEGDSVARLTEALGDKNDFVRAYAARALARIGADARAAVPTLLEHLRSDEEVDIRKLAGKTLGIMGPQAVGPLLPETVAALSDGLKSKSTEFREYAARALGQLGAREAVPALRSAAKDKDKDVRAAALEALKRIESPGPAQ